MAVGPREAANEARIAFATGAIAGWRYGHHSPVCAVLRRNGAPVVVCDYGYRPPVEAFIE